MSRRFIKRLSNVPPHVAIILALVGIVGISGAVLFFKHSEPKAEAMVIPRAARLERVDGHVAIAQALNHADNDQLAWQDAVVNAPLTVGDRVWARDNSYAQIAFTGRNYARLNPGTALDVLSLADQRTQLALRSGSALFDVGYLPDGELYEVATPCGAVDFTEPGLYQLGIGDDGNATISVLSGLAQVVGLAGSGEISKGEVLTLVSQVAAQAVASRLAPDLAGNILDDYYGYRYPNRYDGRYRNYDTYLDDPDYYDPYSHSTAYQYLDEEIPGLYDLDEYGDWQDVDGYGRCWAPRVAADWSPYRAGYWDTYDVWGPTWVSSEPWGYAPYHYGRWAYVNEQRWMWVPEDCRRNAAYAPALVAFIPVQQSEIAWVPLAPGERYVPRYYDASFEPQYLASPQVVEQYISVRNYANLSYPTAVTAVPVQAFTAPINQSVIVPVSPQWIQQAQPVIDPYQVEGVRNVALQQERWQRKQARREMDVTAFNRPVVTSVAPVVPPVQSNVAEAWQVQPVPEKQKRNKLRVENSGQVVATQRPDGVPVVVGQPAQQAFAQQRDQRIAELKARQQQGDRSATQELRQLKQERKQSAQPQPQVWAQQQAPQGMTAKQQRRFERQQQAAAQQPAWAQQRQAAQQAQQAMTQKQQRRLERQQQMAQQQQAAAQQAQVNQQHAQRRAQKEAARQQMMQQQQAQRAQQQAAQQAQSKAQRRAERQQQQQMMMQQQQNQMKAQRRAERQQQAVMQQRQAAQAQADQQRQQMKQQMRMQRQQAAQQQMMQQQAAAQQQMKAQRRAERQQQQQMMMQRQQPQVMQQPQMMRQQEKQQRRYERQQQAAQPQPQQRPQVFLGPPAQQQSKAERKAARRNQ